MLSSLSSARSLLVTRTQPRRQQLRTLASLHSAIMSVEKVPGKSLHVSKPTW